MTDRQLMQQALDALNSPNFGVHSRAILALQERLAHCDRCGKRLGGEGDIHTCTPDPIGDAQSALIVAMAAQPEQEPVAWRLNGISSLGHGKVFGDWKSGKPPKDVADLASVDKNWSLEFTCTTPSPVQEPVARLSRWGIKGESSEGYTVHFLKELPPDGSLFYTTPPAAAHMTEFDEAVAAVDNTLHHAIDHWQDKASEQAALLRECRFAIDTLIEKKPAFAMLLCGSTTLGNLKASLHDYRVKGIFDDTPPAAAKQEPLGYVHLEEVQMLRLVDGMRARLSKMPDWPCTQPIYTTPPAQPAPVQTNCRHCGGPDNVLCAGQCKQATPPAATVEDNSQNWAGMDGTTAWHLIDRHANGWADIGKMMGEWLAANSTPPAAQHQAAERNKLAAWMIAKGYATGHGDTIEGLLEELRWQVRESERDACLSCIKPNATPMEVAAAIRARGQA